MCVCVCVRARVFDKVPLRALEKACYRCIDALAAMRVRVCVCMCACMCIDVCV